MAYERLGVIGNIGNVEKKGDASRPFIKMSVAVDKKDAAGVKETIWYQVIMSSPAAAQNADALLALYQKGKRVLVEGDFKLRPFIDPKGQAAVERTIYPHTRPQLL